MDDILISKENNLFHVDVTDRYGVERLIIYTRTMGDLIDILTKEIDSHCHEQIICWGDDDDAGYNHHGRWVLLLSDIILMTSNFM